MSRVLQKSLLQGLRNTRNPSRRYLSSSFAAIDHSKEYQEAMEGRHGKQLQLAKLDGLGKDDPLFDPFPELERQLQINLSGGGEAIDEGDDFFADNIQEASYKEKDESNEEFLDESEEEVDDEMEEDDTDDGDEENYYRNDGSVPYSKAQLAEFKAGAPAGGLFAIIQLNGTQHKVTVDDVIVNHILKPISKYPIGSILELRDDGILLMGSTHQTLVGMPFVSGGAVVKLMVEEITLDAKVIIFKKRRRKNSQRRNGFRRQVMMFRVLDIQFPPEFALDNHVPRVEPKTDLKRPPSLLEDMKEEYA